MLKLLRMLGVGVGLLMTLVGAALLANRLQPDNPLVARFAHPVLSALHSGAASSGAPAGGSGFLLGSPVAAFGLAPLGLALCGLLLFVGRSGGAGSEQKAGGGSGGYVMPVDKKAQRQARKQAGKLAKKSPLQAGDHCFQNGLMEEAARYFIEAGAFDRAGEVRHGQNRPLEAAELYLKAKKFGTAGAMFADQKEFARAAEAYEQGGNHSVAAELFEKLEDWNKAATCYEAAGFPRHAARAYIKSNQWRKAATCLEEVITESMTGAGASDPKRQAETRKLVLKAAELYQRVEDLKKAQAILERGQCWKEAGAVAERLQQDERAAELFLRAGDVPRAAKILERLGRSDQARRVMAEYLRDKGDDEEAARHFEEAEDWMSAGDLYRLLERFDKAAECYVRFGDFVQAGEMYGSAEQRERAAECYERAGHYEEAAQYYALDGKAAKEAEMLGKAGKHLKAGKLMLELGQEEDAVKILQEIVPEHTDFPLAAAILGEIFRKRGQLSLALKKLTHAVGRADLNRETVQAFYGLATVYEASKQPGEALEIYEKIQAFDVGYADVAKRVAACKEAQEKLTKAGGASVSSPLSGSQPEGRYRITGKLGRGGMGVVFKATDTVLDRTVAFKVLPDQLKENPQALKNFLREAKAAAQLNHPNIVQIFDAGEQAGNYYIAMEYVDGTTLKDIVKAKGRISPGGVMAVASQMAEALAYAHEKKIVHRDIKSANTMWTRDRQAKIMDFGLAKVIEEVRNQTTVVSGTPYYMSPEQTLGKNVDHRTDIYSYGITIFELATGTLPFREGNLPYHHVHTPPPSPLEFVPDLPPLIVQIIERCLMKKADDRYQTAREILAEIHAANA